MERVKSISVVPEGGARQTGILSYLAPVGSTALLMLGRGRPLGGSIALAAVMIIGAALLGSRARQR